jgi:hypothetical protein
VKPKSTSVSTKSRVILLAVLGGLVEKDIEGPYPVEKLYNMGAGTLSTLRQVATDTFHNFSEIKEAMRRFKTHQLSTERELNEVNDLILAWRALAECQNKTIGHVNSIK